MNICKPYVIIYEPIITHVDCVCTVATQPLCNFIEMSFDRMRKQRNQALAVCAYVYVVFHNDGMQARMHAERKKHTN